MSYPARYPARAMVQMPDDLRSEVAAMAAAEDRSFASMVRLLLTEAIDGRRSDV